MAIYGELSLRDRLIRALISALMGAAVALLFMLGLAVSSKSYRLFDLLPKHSDRFYAVTGALLGAFVGGTLGFRRRRV